MIWLVVGLAWAQPRTLLEAGLDRMAANTLGRVVANDPRPGYVALLGVAEARLGRTAVAREHLDIGVAPAAFALEAGVHRADLLRLDGDCAAAAAVRLSYRFDVPPVVEARLWAGAAEDALACGDRHLAEDRALAALAAHDGGAAHTALAQVARAQGDTALAARHLAEAVADPTAGRAQLVAAEWAVADGDLDAAHHAVAVAAVRMRPTPALVAARATVKLAAGDRDAARALVGVPRWSEADHPAILAVRDWLAALRDDPLP